MFTRAERFRSIDECAASCSRTRQSCVLSSDSTDRIASSCNRFCQSIIKGERSAMRTLAWPVVTVTVDLKQE